MSDDTRVDLSPLDPERDPTRLERSARAIASRVAPSLRQRRERVPGLWEGLLGWRRPVMASAALVAVASLVVLAMPVPTTRADSVPARPLTLEEAAGLPAPLAAWVEDGRPPADGALLDVQETP